ncbi:TPA: hypothetical protein ACSB4R_002059, partial [Acinetobacter baumannii]
LKKKTTFRSNLGLMSKFKKNTPTSYLFHSKSCLYLKTQKLKPSNRFSEYSLQKNIYFAENNIALIKN